MCIFFRRRIQSIGLGLLGLLVTACQTLQPVRVEGIVWQPDAQTSRPEGEWQDIGARSLLLQWVVVDGSTFLPDAPWPQVTPETDWDRVSREPWAGQVIVGLAGRFQEVEARAQVEELASVSRLIPPRIPSSINVQGWYFPVEADPSWGDVHRLGRALDGLPRPLWVSVYDKTNMGGPEFVKWLQTWLPDDVGVLFQDGVGEHIRNARTASKYTQALESALGKDRVILIAEAFRPGEAGGFRAATADELRSQLNQYADHSVYVFDGPHYVGAEAVADLSVGHKR